MKFSKKIQKLFAMLLVAVMVVSVLPMGSLSVFAVTTEFAGGDGTAENPYLIATKTQLNNVRNYLNASFKLIADIEFEDSDFQYGGDFYNNGAGFTPIGSSTSVFNGTFDGENHVIKNLYMNIESGSTIYAGLFGYNKGTIKNLGIVDGIVSASASYNSGDAYVYVGAIAGRNTKTITNCYYTGSIDATSYTAGSSPTDAFTYAGGITGYNNPSGTITDCFNQGSVMGNATSDALGTSPYDAAAYTGGIAGISGGTITNCYNTGSICPTASTKSTSSYARTKAYAGGMVGYDSGTTNACYNSGNVSATSYRNAYAGGIAGYNYQKTISNCYNIGSIATTTSSSSSSDANYAGGIAGYNNYEGTTITNCYNLGAVVASGNNPYAGGVAGYSHNEAAITNCYYAETLSSGVSNGVDTTTKCTFEEMKQQSTFAGFDFEAVWIFDEALTSYPFPVLKDVKHIETENTIEFAGGNGTPFSPYLIANKTHLDNVRNYLSADFKLIADIEFTDADFQDGGDFYNGGAGFEPIGTSSDGFYGTFDGNGYVIKNLYINVTSDNNTTRAGLFAFNVGVIKNLGFIDGNISAIASSSDGANAYAGGIVIDNDGTVTDCYYTGKVTATSTYSARAGGIAGINGLGTIKNCSNSGSVSATTTASSTSCYTYAGGIVSYSEGPITNCSNSGEISAVVTSSSTYQYAIVHSYAGGIVGSALETITLCHNTGKVSASAVCTSGSAKNCNVVANGGGIVGNSSEKATISNCYNTGEILVFASSNTSSYANAHSGGIAGHNYGTIKNCFNIGKVSTPPSSSSTYVYINVGGIAGRNDETITDCYNAGDVSANPTSSRVNSYIGGIAGRNYVTITNCYNVGAILSEGISGGITGDNYDGGTVDTTDDAIMTNCYYADSILNGAGIGIDTAVKCELDELTQQSTFVGFDFENVWTFNEEVGSYPLPVLRDIAHIEKDEENTTEFAGGNGTYYNPYLISDAKQLNNVRNYLGAHFKLICDIDLAGHFQENEIFYNGGAGFEPIGSLSSPFYGTFDGDGYAIKDLYINASESEFAGLFGVNSGTIKNLRVIYGTVELSATYQSSNSAIYTYVGGIVGLNYGAITNCFNSNTVSANITAYVGNISVYSGGIVGRNEYGTITNCHNVGEISANVNDQSSYKNSSAYVGGIAGSNHYGTTTDCSNIADISSSHEAGGVVGYNVGTITDCYSSGSQITANVCAGGVVGNNLGTVTDCYNKNFETSSSKHAGGIAGYNHQTITNCYNTGEVTSVLYAGGIAGSNDGTITDCYNEDVILGTSVDSNAGGIVGYNGSGKITNCHNSNQVSANADSYETHTYAGGIAGYNKTGTISNCYNIEKISASGHAGGIAGENFNGTISNCYNIGRVAAVSETSPTYAGGIASINFKTITNCYNTGTVWAKTSSAQAISGGIAGMNRLYVETGAAGTITKCYNIGSVGASSYRTAFMGGIAGSNDDDAKTINCYYSDNNPKGVGSGANDATTKCTFDELKQQSTFVGFDFETVWEFEENEIYLFPTLRDNPITAVIPSTITSSTYNIGENTIGKIPKGTTAGALLDGLNEDSFCKVYNKNSEVPDNTSVGTGTVVKIVVGDTVIASYTIIIIGDISGNGYIDSEDYLLLKRSCFGTYDLPIFAAGDIDKNGKIDSVDYLLVKRICFGTYEIQE